MKFPLHRHQLKQLTSNFSKLWDYYLKNLVVEEDPIELKWAYFKKYCGIEQDSDFSIVQSAVLSEFGNRSIEFVNEFIYVVFVLKHFGKTLELKSALKQFNELWQIDSGSDDNVDIIYASSFFDGVLINEWRIVYLYGKQLNIGYYSDNVNTLWNNFHKFWDIQHYHYLNKYVSLKVYQYLNEIKELEYIISKDSMVILNHYSNFIKEQQASYVKHSGPLPLSINWEIAQKYINSTEPKKVSILPGLTPAKLFKKIKQL